MVVEDDPVIALVLTDRLERLGYEVPEVVASGEEAVEQAAEIAPDMVLMDIQLKGEMDGIEAATRIRSRLKIPVVYVTAYADDPLLERAKLTEPFGYLIKPYGERELRSTIEMALFKGEMETRLRASEARFRGIMENTSDITVVVNKEGVCTYAGPSITRLCHDCREGLQGKTPTDFVHPDDLPLIERMMEQAIDSPGETLTMPSFRANRGDGEWIYIEGLLTCLYDTPGVNGVVFNGRDITDRKKAEEVVLQSERLKAIAELASGVAHHFNNMLQVVLGGAQVARMNLEMGDLAKVKTLLDRIIESSRLGSETVKRLQSFVKSRTDDFGPTMTFDLSDTARHAIETTGIWWKNEPEKKGIHIKMVPILTSGCMISGRDNELFEVITNLIKNATEALVEGGEIRVETSVREDKVLLQVIDTGVGIAREDLGKLFDPFFTTKGFQSAGMGLAGSYGIVKNHGGTISVETTEGEGAAFTVELPLVPEKPVEVEAAAPSISRLKLRILIIDDVEPLLTLFEDGLTDFGQTVFTALSGDEGLRLFEQESVDLVVCNLGMPGMSGWEVGMRIKAICEEKGIPKPPFILLTGSGGQGEEKGMIAESGVDAVVEKPIDVPKLLTVIRKVVEKGPQSV